MRPVDCDAVVNLLRDAAGCKTCNNYNRVKCRCCVWDDAITLVDEFGDNHPLGFGRWKKELGGASPGGTPAYVCGSCGGSEHLYGAEYPKKRLICKQCGSINVYPWEKVELD